MGDIEAKQVSINPRLTKRGGSLESSSLEKFSLVFGIPVFAFSGVDDSRLETVASVLSEFLDNDGDGVPENEDLVKVLQMYTASLVLTETQAQKRTFFYIVKVANCAPAYQLPGIMAHFESAAFVGDLEDNLDRTLGFLTDFLVQFGYPHTYNPERTIVARKVEEYFEISKKKGWLRSEIVGNDDHTLRQEYQKWLLKSAIGVDEEECGYWGIWTLCTPDELRRAAPVLFQTMKYSLAVPDGRYNSPALIS